MSALDAVVVGALNPVEGKVVSVPTHAEIDDKIQLATHDSGDGKDGTPDFETKALPKYSDDDDSRDDDSRDAIIVTGADAAAHLLPLRDDGEPSLTFRSIFLATCLSAFQAVMKQIYAVS